MIRFASLGSGSAGNALLVEAGATCPDARLRLRVAGNRDPSAAPRSASLADLDGIVVTHEHGDHVGGVFRLARKYELPVWLDAWHLVRLS